MFFTNFTLLYICILPLKKIFSFFITEVTFYSLHFLQFVTSCCLRHLNTPEYTSGFCCAREAEEQSDSKYKQILLNKSSWSEQGCCNSYFIRAFDCGSVSLSCLQAGASSVNTASWIIYFTFHFVGWQAVIGFFSAGFSLLGALRSYRKACFYFQISNN